MVTDGLLQAKLDEMELKYKLLLGENADLKSQLDIMHKQSKENRKLIEKYSELKVEKQRDAAILADLVCIIQYVFYCKISQQG